MKSSIPTKLKEQTEKILWITFFWILISLVQFVTGYTTLLQFGCDLAGLSPAIYVQGSIVTGLTAGLIGGSFMVFFWERWLRSKSYAWSLLNIFWSYTLIYITVSLITGLLFNAGKLDVSLLHPKVWKAILDEPLANHFQNYFFWLSVVIITLITLLVNDKYGPGVFKSFILGKYFHPKREERIFMFLDLRGSTSIAEKLGERLYFNFLRDVIKDATPGILNSKGEIYQYVGDEIVVSWKKESGSQNANCLKCFFDIQQKIRQKSSYYESTYNLIPEFKAGLHYGFVTVGEIGIVKREIAYSGDVLNTTARIQSKCNDLGVNILLSKYLLDKLGFLPNPFKSVEIGKIELRGKQNAIELYTV